MRLDGASPGSGLPYKSMSTPIQLVFLTPSFSTKFFSPLTPVAPDESAWKSYVHPFASSFIGPCTAAAVSAAHRSACGSTCHLEGGSIHSPRTPTDRSAVITARASTDVSLADA